MAQPNLSKLELEEPTNVILQLHHHFKNNFMLEIQYHDTDSQRDWNQHLLELHNKYGIELIVGLDSHYILENDSWQRDIVLDAKEIHYDDEEGWYMDYPSDEIVFFILMIICCINKNEKLREFVIRIGKSYGDGKKNQKSDKISSKSNLKKIPTKSKNKRKKSRNSSLRFPKQIPKRQSGKESITHFFPMTKRTKPQRKTK